MSKFLLDQMQNSMQGWRSQYNNKWIHKQFTIWMCLPVVGVSANEGGPAPPVAVFACQMRPCSQSERRFRAIHDTIEQTLAGETT